MLITTQLRQQAVTHLDRLQVIGVVIIERNNLNMRSETRYFLRDGLFKTDHNTDRQNHHHYTHNHTCQSHPNGRSGSALFTLLREI